MNLLRYISLNKSKATDSTGPLLTFTKANPPLSLWAFKAAQINSIFLAILILSRKLKDALTIAWHTSLTRLTPYLTVAPRRISMPRGSKPYLKFAANVRALYKVWKLSVRPMSLRINAEFSFKRALRAAVRISFETLPSSTIWKIRGNTNSLKFIVPLAQFTERL